MHIKKRRQSVGCAWCMFPPGMHTGSCSPGPGGVASGLGSVASGPGGVSGGYSVFGGPGGVPGPGWLGSSVGMPPGHWTKCARLQLPLDRSKSRPGGQVRGVRVPSMHSMKAEQSLGSAIFTTPTLVWHCVQSTVPIRPQFWSCTLKSWVGGQLSTWGAWPGSHRT